MIHRELSYDDCELIYKALVEYEETHWESENGYWQKCIEHLTGRFNIKEGEE